MVDAGGPGLGREERPDARTRLVETFLRGLCGPFALALHERAGWDIVGVFDGPGGFWTDKPRHVACVDPEGGYADSRGRGFDAGALLDGFRCPMGSGSEIRPLAALELRAILSARPPEQHRLAESAIDELIPGLPGASMRGP